LDVREITVQAVNDVKHRGVESSGSTSLAMCVSEARAIHLPPPSKKTTHLIRGAFFILDVREITVQAVNDVKHRGVESSGSTSLAMCVNAARAIHLPVPFLITTD